MASLTHRGLFGRIRRRQTHHLSRHPWPRGLYSHAARGAQITDVAVIVVAADDDVMPQTKEAISHAQAAEVPFVVAINKVDKETANPDKIREGLSQLNVLTEDWGGKIQSQEISAKTGQGIKELLDKVLLEAEMLELKANPDRAASGTLIEASLDEGRRLYFHHPRTIWDSADWRLYAGRSVLR